MESESLQHEGILFLCLARDCESNLPRFFELLRALRLSGVPCHAIVGEHGSVDGTRQCLLEAAHDGVTLLDTAEMVAPQRLARMAIGREMLLKAAHDAAPAAFVCVADLDEVMEQPPTVPAVMATLQELRRQEKVFAISCTSSPYYYDLLALSAPGYDFATLDAEIRAAKRRPWTYYQFQRRRIYSQQKAITASPPATCTSSFNGLCVYKAADYLRGSYRSAREGEICEHVTLHVLLARLTGKHMRISTAMAMQTPADHLPVGFLRFWYDRLRKAVKKRML